MADREGTPATVSERKGEPRDSIRKKGITPETVSEGKGGTPRYCPKEKGEHSVRYKMGIHATVSK